MEDIANKCAGLRLSEIEESEVDLTPPTTDTGLALAGRFCTKRRLSLEAVARVLKSIWRTERNFEIHGLPTMNQTKEAGLRIGGILGEVVKADVDENGFCLGGYLRIRVAMDITQLLCRGRRVRIGESVATWVDFKFERLPIFCYWCGKVDHDERDCLQWIRSKETLRPKDKQYGPWLRASQDRLQRPQLVLASNRSNFGHQSLGEGDEGVGSTSYRSEKRGDDQGQEHVTDDVESTRLDTASTELLRPREEAEISHHRNPAIFEEQLREIDAAITTGIPNLAAPPLIDSISDFADNTTKTVDFLNSNKKSTEEDKVVGPTVGLTSEMGLNSLVSALKKPVSHSTAVGQELRPSYGLFSIGSHTIKPLSGFRKRDVTGTIQKKKKQVRKGVGEENLMQEEREHEYGVEVVRDIVKVMNDNEGNIPAHLLAHHARNIESYVAWLEECPSLIEHACAHDLVSSSRDE
ncbi:hypothetical protein SO802_020869 [Lithocarpus litseifolius]|uniref:Zinc knuckle CX2CX4HX4C domain-containing protein n=1 Tax=Lithocarpus litseifolius TaxID=425828 RepID=A0AAW2CF86_9ROSI